MAESIAAIVFQQLATLIDVVKDYSGELREDLQFIKDEFEHLTAFLRVADAASDKDPEVAVWVKQVREVAHDIEDVLDEYNLHFSSRRGSVWWKFSSLKRMRAHTRLASAIRSIKSRVHDISKGHQRYRCRYEIGDQASTSGSGLPNSSEVDGRGAALLQEEAELVGIPKRKGELLRLLLDGNYKPKVLSVVGMGGIGKTTLVRKVFEDVDVMSQFECHAWITVSKSFHMKELLKNLIEQLFEEIKEPIPQKVHSMDDNGLRAFIKQFLQRKRYFIVFDDIWDTDLWDDIAYTLSNSSTHSRVVLTTRIANITSVSCTSFTRSVYKMEPLSQEESWMLFCSKVFKDNCCPPHLKDISGRILSKSGDLPLAIVAIGGILASKDMGRIDNWEMIYRSIGVELEGEGKLDRVKRILLLSFFDLPHHLKLCLLYLSIFPEDHKMEFMQLIRLWIAEGFVEEKEGLTLEEVGESYLNELVNRSLLQIVETKADGAMRAFGVHDILREIIISKSKKENIVTIVGEGTVSWWPNKVRRLAIQGPMENPTESSKFRRLRSLVLFSAKDLPPKPLLSKLLCGGSRILKVLDFRGAPLEVIPDEIFKLTLLTYLSLRGTNVKTIPKSIRKLRNLETLDLKQTFVSELPLEILKLRRLRHLLVYRYRGSYVQRDFQSGVLGFRAPDKIGSLVSLQKLNNVEADERNGVKIVTEIGKLTQLRRIGITKLRREDGKDLCSSLERLTNLRTLYVDSTEHDEIIDLQYTLCSIPHLLRSLYLYGRLAKIPQWIHSLRGLTNIVLRRSRLEDDPLQYLEDLPNLVRLVLEYRACDAEELHFKAGKFQRLKELFLRSLKELRRVILEDYSLPFLEKVLIKDCKLMEELPFGIENMSKLQDLILIDMAEKLVRPLLNREKRSTQAKILVGTLMMNGSYEWRYLYARR